jgi:AraC-like DNA-binding protein
LPVADRFGEWLSQIEVAFQVSSEVLDGRPPRFDGAVQKHVIGRMTLISVTGTWYAASHARRGRTDQVGVLLALRGSTRLSQDGFDLVLKPCEYCVLDSTASSVTIIPAPFHNVVVRFPAADVEAIVPSWHRSIGKVIDGRAGAGAVFFDVIRGVLRQSRKLSPESGSGVATAAVGLLGSALLSLPHNQQTSPTQMEHYHRTRIKAFVQDHLRDPDLDVETVARHLGLSPRHIHRLFKDEPQHLMHWVWSERLRLCYDDLCRPHLRHRTLAQIAYAWGFNDSAHFSRAFRQRYGIAPSEVRDRTFAK